MAKQTKKPKLANLVVGNVGMYFSEIDFLGHVCSHIFRDEDELRSTFPLRPLSTVIRSAWMSR